MSCSGVKLLCTLLCCRGSRRPCSWRRFLVLFTRPCCKEKIIPIMQPLQGIVVRVLVLFYRCLRGPAQHRCLFLQLSHECSSESVGAHGDSIVPLPVFSLKTRHVNIHVHVRGADDCGEEGFRTLLNLFWGVVLQSCTGQPVRDA